MAFNGSGVFNRIYNWVTDKANTVPVTASRMDTEMDGFATGLSTCLTKDGQQTATARIPFALGTAAMAGAVGGVSYAAINDPNTGLYFPAADEWGLVAGGTATLKSTATVVTVPSGITLKSNTTPYDAFASGTVMLFQQTSAPTGWTKGATHNDKALRVVTGAVGSGGSSAFSTVFSKTATDSFTLATTNLPAYTPSGTNTKPNITLSDVTNLIKLAGNSLAINVGATQGVSTPTAALDNAPVFTGDAQGGASTAKTAGMDIRVQYVDVIIATKD